MPFTNLASETLEAVGDPIAFSRAGVLIDTFNGVFRNAQQNIKSKSKVLRVIDCDTVTTVYSDLIQSGDTVDTGFSTHKVAGKPIRDGSGGMILKLSSKDIEESQHASVLDR